MKRYRCQLMSKNSARHPSSAAQLNKSKKLKLNECISSTSINLIIVCIFKSCQPDVCEETTFVMLIKYYKMNNCLFMADCLQQICWWEGCIKYKLKEFYCRIFAINDRAGRWNNSGCKFTSG